MKFTKADLRECVTQTGSYFFTRNSMRFFGDTMANYGIRKTIINNQEVYELYRKKPVKHGLVDSAYFDTETFKRVFPQR